VRRYIWNVLIGLDQLLNAVCLGDPDETVSSRLGKLKLRRGGQLTWGDWFGIALPLDWILDKIDPGHSIDAIESDEGQPVYDRRGNVVGLVIGRGSAADTPATRRPTARDPKATRGGTKATKAGTENWWESKGGKAPDAPADRRWPRKARGTK